MRFPRISSSARSRRWLLVCGLLVVVMVTIGCRPTPVNQPETQAKNEEATEVGTAAPRRAVNVVIFLIDTLRADYLHVYGYSQPTSPTMDALAAVSVLFEQANAPAPWTLPTVASLMLSQFVAEHGVVYDQQRISPDADPIAARMRRAGFATASFLRNGYAGRMTGLDKGYDFCRMMSKQTDGPTIRPWLDRLGEQPFFLYIHNTEPHNPYEAVDRYLDQFGKLPPGTRRRFRLLSRDYRALTRADFDGKQTLGNTDNTAEQRKTLARFDSMRAQVEIMYPATVLQSDENLRSVIDELKRRDVWDKTLFILLADHGEEMGEHGMWQHDQSVYEELIRVPLIIHFPHDEFAGRRVSEPVSLVDVLPTVMDYLNQPELSRGARGTSLLPIIHGAAGGATGRLKVTAMRHNQKKYYRLNKERRGDLNIVVRQGMWKGIWNAEVGTFELYDLADDPAESENLSVKEAERTEQMRAFAQSWLRMHQAYAPTANQAVKGSIDAETLEQLKTLGYVDDGEASDDEEPNEP